MSGAVSLFVVIFSALLITVITVGFAGIMIRDQRQATDNDLSQSAYSTAQAGVEDGKRAIIRYINCKGVASLDCDKIRGVMENAALTPQTCTNTIDGLDGVTVENGEVDVKSGTSDDKFNQAYTCVKIKLNTSEYLGVLPGNNSKLVPLTSKNDAYFNKVQVDWFIKTDLQSGNTADVPGILSKLLMKEWGAKPSIMRVQLIQYGSNGFKLTDFDNDPNSNSRTLFLYPSTVSAVDIDFSKDIRGNPNALGEADIEFAHCTTDFSGNGGYACTATLLLPDPIGGGNRTAFLNVTPLFAKANFRVSLYNSLIGELVEYSGQPEIDSTGRTNDVFRRVKSRVEMTNTNYTYPEAAVDIEGDINSLCKAFDVGIDYYNEGPCTL